MKALHDLNLTRGISYAGQGQALIELYNDLRNLKENKIMEANAPEKIYVHVRANKELGTTWHGTWIGVHDIEYVHKDAFIEKAADWLRTHSEVDYFELIPDANYCGAGNLNKKKMIEDFKKYMEG